MKINILICSDNDEPLLNETVSNIGDAVNLLTSVEYEFDARNDEVTSNELG